MPSTAPEPIPESFQSQVRDALMHLYDYAYLVRHPLVDILVPVKSRTSAGHALRNVVLDAIEELHPDPAIPRGTRGWRPYDILTQRFVDGFGVDDILESLHISLRQFQREQRRAILAVTSVLWQRQLVPEEPDAPARDVKTTRLAAEVERMGLYLESVDLQEIIGNAIASVMPLAKQNRGDVVVESVQSVLCVVDRTLLRQALVIAISAPLSAGDCVVYVSWVEKDTSIALDLHAHLSPNQMESVRQRLDSMGDLLESQAIANTLACEEDGDWRLSLSLRGAQDVHILIVDDDSRLRQLYGRYLESEGYQSKGVSSAQEALATLESNVPALIILDVMMRDMDGWQLLQVLRSRPALLHTPVIVCSVLNEPDLAHALGAQCYLRKPITPQALVSAVQRLLSLGGMAV